MKRIGNQRIEDFPAATLYLDDLEEIVTIFDDACKTIEISAGDYTIDDARELTALAEKCRGRFEDIEIQGYDPYVSVDLRTFKISAYISEDSLEQRGIIAKVRDVVGRGKKRDPAWLSNALIGVMMFAGITAAANGEYILGLISIIVTFAFIPLVVKYQMNNTVVVYNAMRGRTKSFFQRRKDDLRIAAISAILGSVVTYLITRYLP